jgi:hypothetical protein
MKLESNVNGVLDRVRRMPRDIRAAMARTLAPGATPHGQTREKALAEEAKRTLWALSGFGFLSPCLPAGGDFRFRTWDFQLSPTRKAG